MCKKNYISTPKTYKHQVSHQRFLVSPTPKYVFLKNSQCWQFSNIWLFTLWHYWISIINVNSSDFSLTLVVRLSLSEYCCFTSFLGEMSVIWFILINKFTFPLANSCPGNLPKHAFCEWNTCICEIFMKHRIIEYHLLNHSECDATSELSSNCVASGTNFKHVSFI